MKRITSIGLALVLSLAACSDDQDSLLQSEAPRDPSVRATNGSSSLNVDLDQWANGTDKTSPEWQNGNLNGNNSQYAELRVVPFRLAIEGLTPGTHTIHINHDFTAGGRKAYDFLASVDATELLAETGYATVEAWLCGTGGGAVSSLCTSEGGPGLGSYDAEVFPYDPFNATPYLASARQVGGGIGGLTNPGTIDGTPTSVQLAGLTDEERQLRIYGGSITDISMPTHDGPLDGNSTADLIVEFTTTGSAVLFVWGGQLSCSLCWESLIGGEPNGASQISGAPWHMRTQNLDGGGASNQDRSIQPSAVVSPGNIDGFKYHDLNANGSRDASEPGLEGWEIRLTFGSEQLTAFTDSTGYFIFESLPPGLYDVAEVCPINGWRQSEPVPTDGCGSGIHDDVMVMGEDTVTVVFGNYEQATKAGHKYHDLNANGAWDEGEPPLEGWTIQAWQGATLVSSTTTDSLGAYSFNLEPGSYTIREVCDEGWIQSQPVPSDGCGSGTYAVTLGSGTIEPDNDFGNYQLATKSGSKWHDLNANGTWDEGEPGLENWWIRVTGTTGIGDAVSDSTMTDATGAYSFSLVPGSYTVAEVCPASNPLEWKQTYPTPTDGCGSGVHDVTLTSGQVDEGNDFGNFEDPIKAGHKYHDLNANGAWDEGEPPLEGWTIQAWQGETLIASTVTDSTGYYEFELEPGAHTIREVCQEGWMQSEPAPTDGCGSGVYEIDLLAGEIDDGNNFGNYQLASKSGSKWHDLNANGTWDEGEPGLENWWIRVTGTTGMGDAVSDSTMTDATGAYSFNLVPGSYTVAEVCPINGWIQSYPTPTDGCGSGVHDVTLTSAQVDEGNDFGNYEQATKAGHKYHDLNANGAWDEGEPPLEGWTIQAWQGETLVSSTTTDSLGAYSFNLEPGSYTIREVCDEGWIQSQPVPTDGCGSGTYQITLGSGTVEPDNDFGNYQLASKSGVKYRDAAGDGDDDGMPDSEDSPLDGFTIQLFDDVDGSGTLTMGDTLITSSVTDMGGAYSFAGLAPGNYVVCEQTLSSWILSYPANEVCGDGMSGLETGGWAVSLTSGMNEVANNFFNTSEVYGCTPGYWKNHTDRWVGYSWNDPLSAAFDATHLAPFATNTMLEALNFRGGSGTTGGKQILLRAAVSSLLNMAHPDVAFIVPEQGSLPALSTAEGLIAAVESALASDDRSSMLALATQLDDANNAVNMCPLSGTRAFRPN